MQALRKTQCNGLSPKPEIHLNVNSWNEVKEYSGNRLSNYQRTQGLFLDQAFDEL